MLKLQLLKILIGNQIAIVIHYRHFFLTSDFKDISFKNLFYKITFWQYCLFTIYNILTALFEKKKTNDILLHILVICKF